MKARCSLLSGVLLLTILAGAAEPEPKAGMTQEHDDWFTYHYIVEDKTGAPAVAAIKAHAATGVFENPESAQMMGAFFAVLLTKDREGTLDIIRRSGLKGRRLLPVVLGLWYSGQSDAASQWGRKIPLSQAIQDRIQNQSFDLLAFPISTPSHLDMMWAAFVASGDTRYVKRIVDVVDRPKGDGKASQVNLLLKYAARWSLGSNARQHELVRRLCAREARRRKGETREWLLEIVKKADNPGDPFAKRKGRFSAKMVVTADLSFYDSWKSLPRTEGPLLKVAPTASRGQTVGVPILFMGQALDDSLNARVTYDVTVVKPDGTEYFSARDLIAIQRKRPTSMNVELAGQGVRIKFEPDDPLGTYKIRATLTDNVSSAALQLSAAIVLEE